MNIPCKSIMMTRLHFILYYQDYIYEKKANSTVHKNRSSIALQLRIVTLLNSTVPKINFVHFVLLYTYCHKCE